MTRTPNTKHLPFSETISDLISYTYAHAPYFKFLLDSNHLNPNDFSTPADLEKIPVTHKDDLIRLQAENPPFGGWLAQPVSQLRRIFLSPGPIFDPEGDTDDFWHFEKALRLAGFREGDVVQNTFSYHMTPGGFMLDAGLRKIGCVVFPAGVGNTDLQVKAALSQNITGYTGTPSYLMAILKRAEEMGIHPKKELHYRVALVTGEPLPPSLRREFQEDYGISVFQVYATADIGCAGFECTQQEGWHVSDQTLVQICDPATGKECPPGETGEIVVTHFNATYPLIRFGTGDLSFFMKEPCPCGDASPRLGGYKGRVGEGVKVKGMFVHPSQVWDVLKKIPCVKDFQILVTRTGHKDILTYQLIAAETGCEGRTDEIEEALKSVVKVYGNVKWVHAFEIPDRRVIDVRKWE
ncbi:MAG: phenylacetate--CoA ligase [Calditrichaeota bacterium]|nr:phenylacetate--CoA ligase [Calditrichota bacterium]